MSENNEVEQHVNEFKGSLDAALTRVAEKAYQFGYCDGERAALSKFKNFHRLLCERFGYTHDEQDWQRDQLSLIEWIAGDTRAALSRTAEAQPVARATSMSINAHEMSIAALKSLHELATRAGYSDAFDALSKIAAMADKAPAVSEGACEHEWKPMTAPHKECVKCGDVRLDASHPTARADDDTALFCDLRTDEAKSNFFLSGQGYSSGVIAKSIQNDVAMAYHRCAEHARARAAERKARREASADAANGTGES